MSNGRTIDTELCAECASRQDADEVKIEILDELEVPPPIQVAEGKGGRSMSQESPFQIVNRWTEEHMKRYLAQYPETHGDEYRRTWQHTWHLVGYGEDSWRSHYDFAIDALDDHHPDCLDACMSCSQMEFGFAKLIVKVYDTTHGATAWISPKLPVENADAGSSLVSEDKAL